MHNAVANLAAESGVVDQDNQGFLGVAPVGYHVHHVFDLLVALQADAAADANQQADVLFAADQAVF
ncbi:hypothetical protein [Aquitalea pelogenes]|uniref:hypothetical protein n=1 Tax=Aquitalea pelogenes TaxID=1293573 RepID=UPI0035B3784B